jgi:S1-C subfamily serine protease
MKLLAAAALAMGLVVAPPSAPRAVTVRAGADAATGFVVGDGRVLTVAHVLGPHVRVDGRAARLLRRDDRLDLALLAVPGVRGEAPRIASRDPRIVRRADARVDGSGWRRPVLELRTEVEDGDSGSPVVASDGRLVGVVFARSRVREGVAWAVDASDPAFVDFVGLGLTKSTTARAYPGR